MDILSCVIPYMYPNPSMKRSLLDICKGNKEMETMIYKHQDFLSEEFRLNETIQKLEEVNEYLKKNTTFKQAKIKDRKKRNNMKINYNIAKTAQYFFILGIEGGARGVIRSIRLKHMIEDFFNIKFSITDEIFKAYINGKESSLKNKKVVTHYYKLQSCSL